MIVATPFSTKDVENKDRIFRTSRKLNNTYGKKNQRR
jgi:hypothetical protein